MAASQVGVFAVLLAAAFLIWTQSSFGEGWTWIPLGIAAVALVLSLLANARGLEGWAFLATCIAIVGAVATMFGSLYPDVLPSTTDPAYSLTISNASSSHYTLTIMTWVALIFTPLVLMYQGWTYWVFRRRISVDVLPPYEGLPPREGAAASR
jgi:cytochrome d ubiquinol oxidase subunit II